MQGIIWHFSVFMKQSEQVVRFLADTACPSHHGRREAGGEGVRNQAADRGERQPQGDRGKPLQADCRKERR